MAVPVTLRDINITTGKLLVNMADQAEINAYLRYVAELENLLDEADLDDYFGTEGWQHRLGID